jgi:hypothetical protein
VTGTIASALRSRLKKLIGTPRVLGKFARDVLTQQAPRVNGNLAVALGSLPGYAHELLRAAGYVQVRARSICAALPPGTRSEPACRSGS